MNSLLKKAGAVLLFSGLISPVVAQQQPTKQKQEYDSLSNQVIDVVLIGGQSNATGQGQTKNIPRSYTIDREVMIYYSKFTNQGEKSMQWIPLCPASDKKEKVGLELTLGGTLHRLYPNRRIALIKHACSGANLHSQWNPGCRSGNTTGEEYQKFIATVKEGIESLKAQGYTPVIRCMVWQQGEADSRFDAGETNSNAYGENLSNFIQQVRKEMNAEEMLFVYGTVLPMAAERFKYRDLIKKAQYEVSEAAGSELSVKGAILVPADDLQMLRNDFQSPDSGDDVHLGTFGVMTLGERFAKAIQQATPFWLF